MKLIPTIGLEMHCEISNTNTKVFSSAPNDYNEIANASVSPVDMAFPGILPVVNKEAVRKSIMMALILNSRIPEYMYFERKNYYYPDLPKGYQITQNPPEDPVGLGGYLDILREDGTSFRVDIDNIHLEEDSAQMTHLYNKSVINYNRAGVPLLELVTAPCIHSADDTVTFLEYVRSVYRYAGISEADSKKGQIRCDVNISLAEEGSLGTKVEIKNVNSFSSVREAINYEIARQTELIESGRANEIDQETRRFDELTGKTIHMRSKVDAIDYKYFVEPNIPKYKIDESWIDDIKKSIPSLPYERKEKYINEYNLSEYDANIIIKDMDIANYFEECVSLGCNPKQAANYLTSMILGFIYKENIEIKDLYLTPSRLKVIIDNIESNKISTKQGKELFNLVLERKEEPEKLIESEGMVQLSDDTELTNIIVGILDRSNEQITAYKNGKTNIFGYFVGEVMKETKGKANPNMVKTILETELSKR